MVNLEDICQNILKTFKKSFYQLKLLLHLPCCHILSFGDVVHTPFLVMVVLSLWFHLPQVKNLKTKEQNLKKRKEKNWREAYLWQLMPAICVFYSKRPLHCHIPSLHFHLKALFRALWCECSRIFSMLQAFPSFGGREDVGIKKKTIKKHV